MKRIGFLIIGLAIAGFPGAAQAQTVTVNGQPLYLSPGPIVRAGRVLVPLRGIFERLGASVVYSAGTINATKGGTTVSLRIGSTQAEVSGEPTVIDVAPFIVGATTYVPLRFIAQSLGASVGYDASTRIVAIVMSGEVVPIGPVRPPRPPRPNPVPMPVVNLYAQQPAPGERVANRFVTISAQFTHRVEPGTVRVWLDDNNITSRSAVSANGLSYKPPAPLDAGSHRVRVAGRGGDGTTFDRSWSFAVAGAPPPPANPIDLRGRQPAPGASVNNRFIVVSAEFTRDVDPGSVRVMLDGNNITSRSGVSATGFSYKPPAPLDFGSHTVRVTGRGPAGGSPFDRSWSFSVKRAAEPPLSLTINQPAANTPVGRSFSIQGSTVANGHVKVTAGATPSFTGQFSGSTDAGPRGNFRIGVNLSTMPGQQAVSIRVTVTDPATSRSTETTLQLRLNQ
ncbi:MAG TPA: stalk domain-containing protein [Candidatus Cybelea sp.]|nr:stalk domain-containing protein [Candidatus Cybelea sp.]